MRWLAWLWLAISIAATDLALVHEGSGLRMLALVLVTLYAMKALVVVACHCSGQRPLPFGNWLLIAPLFVNEPATTLFRAPPRWLWCKPWQGSWFWAPA